MHIYRNQYYKRRLGQSRSPTGRCATLYNRFSETRFYIKIVLLGKYRYCLAAVHGKPSRYQCEFRPDFGQPIAGRDVRLLRTDIGRQDGVHWKIRFRQHFFKKSLSSTVHSRLIAMHSLNLSHTHSQSINPSIGPQRCHRKRVPHSASLRAQIDLIAARVPPHPIGAGASRADVSRRPRAVGEAAGVEHGVEHDAADPRLVEDRRDDLSHAARRQTLMRSLARVGAARTAAERERV